MTWRSRPMLGIDSETTGVDVESDRIVTFCAGLASASGWSPRNWLLTQAEPIPQGATDVHGITSEYANEHGVSPATALPEIVGDLYRAWDSGMPVVGFNIVYDLTILDRELRRNEFLPLEVRGPVLDPIVLDKHVDRYRRGSRKLIDVAAHYGVPLDEADAHGAEADALAACRVAWKLGAMRPVGEDWSKTGYGRHEDPPLADWDLIDLHDLQVEAYREQRESFAAYLAKKGERLDDPNTVWPLKPHATATKPAA